MGLLDHIFSSRPLPRHSTGIADSPHLLRQAGRGQPQVVSASLQVVLRLVVQTATPRRCCRPGREPSKRHRSIRQSPPWAAATVAGHLGEGAGISNSMATPRASPMAKPKNVPRWRKRAGMTSILLAAASAGQTVAKSTRWTSTRGRNSFAIAILKRREPNVCPDYRKMLDECHKELVWARGAGGQDRQGLRQHQPVRTPLLPEGVDADRVTGPCTKPCQSLPVDIRKSKQVAVACFHSPRPRVGMSSCVSQRP